MKSYQHASLARRSECRSNPYFSIHESRNKNHFNIQVIDFFAKFNIWPPDLVFVMDDLHKQLTAIYACVYVCVPVFKHYPRDMCLFVAVCKVSYAVYACGFVYNDSYVAYACGFVCKDSYVVCACRFD